MATSYLAVAGISVGMLLSGYYLGKITFSILRDREKKSRHNIDDLAEEFLEEKTQHERHRDFAGSYLDPSRLLQRIRQLDEELKENGVVRLNAIEAAFVLENLRDHIVKSRTGDHYLLSMDGLHAFRSYFEEMNLPDFVKKIRRIEKAILPQPGEKPKVNAEALFYKARNNMIRKTEGRDFFTLGMLDERSIVCKVVPSEKVTHERTEIFSGNSSCSSGSLLRRDEHGREYVYNKDSGEKYIYDDEQGLIVEYTKGKPQEKNGGSAISEMVNKLIEHNIHMNEEQQRRLEVMNEAQAKKMEMLLEMIGHLAKNNVDVSSVRNTLDGSSESIEAAIGEARKRASELDIDFGDLGDEEIRAKQVAEEPTVPGINAPEVDDAFDFADSLLGEASGEETDSSMSGAGSKRTVKEAVAGMGKNDFFELARRLAVSENGEPFGSLLRMSSGSFFVPYFYFAHVVDKFSPLAGLHLIDSRIDMVMLDSLISEINDASEATIGKGLQMFHPNPAKTLRALMEWSENKYSFDVLMLNRKFVGSLPNTVAKTLEENAIKAKTMKINPPGSELKGAVRPEMDRYRPKGASDE